MRPIRRILFRGAAGLAGLMLLTAGGGYLWLRTSLPESEGRIDVPGLKAPARIVRDSSGLVHIRAESEGAAYFALGFAHAQDRLWQMEVSRRLGAGRLAAIGGKRFLNRDRIMRTLGLYRLAQSSYGHLTVPVRQALEDYAAGVNAWMQTRNGALPPEFQLFRYTPEPWSPVDSLVWGRLMAIMLSSNWRTEALRARLTGHIPEEALQKLWLPYPAGAPVTIPDGDGREEAGLRPPANADAPLPVADARRHAALMGAILKAFPPAPPGGGKASNAWVVSGARTETGKPVLANDPHLRLRLPNIWHLARITAPGLTVAGATAPGVPFHILGHNGKIAWGLTTTGADTEDLVIETPDPDSAERYVTPTGAQPFTRRTEVIEVAGEEAQTIAVRETRNGPVISDVLDDIPVGDGKAPVALRSTALAADDRTAEAIYRINRASGWEAFSDALAYYDSPVQNFTYADTEGHIGFRVAGRIPIRPRGEGFAPVPGDQAIYDWWGYIPAQELPHALNPAAGYMANANNRVIGSRYPHFIAREWEAPYRALRIEEVLASQTSHSLADSRRLQMDPLSLAAKEMVSVLLHETPPTSETADVLKRLSDWDKRMSLDRPEPLIFTTWLEEVVRTVFADEFGKDYARFARGRPMLIREVLSNDRDWCDDTRTRPQETCPLVLDTALRTALDRLRQLYGKDPLKLRWGDAHIARFENPWLSWIPVIGQWTGHDIATEGGNFTVNRGTARSSKSRSPFAHVHGATLRAIYDLSDLDRSLFIQPAGQSGNPLSPHYDDMTARWRDGAYLTLPARPEGELQELRLVPRRD